MANRFVRKTGSDAANGNSAATAWLTINKALGAAGAASGDVVYIGAGVFREVVTVAMTSPAAETKFVADVDGAMTGDAGEVRWTAYTTNDKTLPSASATLTLNGRANLTFEGITFQGGSGNTVTAAAGSTGITFRRCAFLPGSSIGASRHINVTVNADVAANWLFDQCLVYGGEASGILVVTAPTSTVADYDLAIVATNCLFLIGANYWLRLVPSGASSFKPGGVKAIHCTFLGDGGALTTAANSSTSIPCQVLGSVIWSGASTALSAAALGQITEDYNAIYASTPRTNVTAGSNSKSDGSYAFLLEFGQRVLRGLGPVLGCTPTLDSPLLGFGTPPGAPSVDVWNRPRPAGGQATTYAVGCLERHDTAAKETTTTDAGGVGLKIVGPGDHDLKVPVSATATTITVKARYDATHGSTNKPQAILLGNGEIGVATATVTMTAAADAWENLTIGPFTPTAVGVVTIRLVSRSAGGAGQAFFDTMMAPSINTGDFAQFVRGEPLGVAVTPAAGGGGLQLARGMMGGFSS